MTNYTKKVNFKDTEGNERTITLFSSVRGILTFKQAFGQELLDALEGADNDVLLGLKIAYALAKPCMFGKVSFEDFADTIPLDQIVPISQEVVPFITMAFQKENEEIETTKNL